MLRKQALVEGPFSGEVSAEVGEGAISELEICNEDALLRSIGGPRAGDQR